jgi:hypothetical protein
MASFCAFLYFLQPGGWYIPNLNLFLTGGLFLLWLYTARTVILFKGWSVPKLQLSLPGKGLSPGFALLYL